MGEGKVSHANIAKRAETYKPNSTYHIYRRGKKKFRFSTYDAPNAIEDLKQIGIISVIVIDF